MQSKTVTAATILEALSIQCEQFMALLMKSGSFVGLINVPIFPTKSRPQSGPGEWGVDPLLGLPPHNPGALPSLCLHCSFTLE